LVREGQILGEADSISFGRTSEATEAIERALAIARDLARRDATDFASQFRVFNAETKLAGIVGRDQPARAAALYDDALGRLAPMAANASNMRNQAEALAASVYPLLRLGRRAAARKRLDAAFECLRALQQYPAEKIELGSVADQTVRASAEYEAADGRVPDGAARYEELICQALAAGPRAETSLEDALSLSRLYASAARLERLAGHPGMAASLETRRTELWQRWNSRLPDNTFVQQWVGQALPPARTGGKFPGVRKRAGA